MMLNAHGESVVVSGRRRFDVRVVPTDPPRSISLTIGTVGGDQWSFEQPGWRGVAVGAGPDGAYLWSARQVVSLPSETQSAPVVEATVDEDLLTVFSDAAGWLLVCETSVRRVHDSHELARIDFGGVIEAFSWVGPEQLAVRLDDESEHHLLIRGVSISG